MAADGMSSVISLGSVEMLRNERRKRATENAEAHGWAAEMKRNMNWTEVTRGGVREGGGRRRFLFFLRPSFCQVAHLAPPTRGGPTKM